MIRIFRHYISRAYLWLLLIEFCMFFSAMYFGCQTAWKNGQGIRENSVENCPP